MTKLILKSSSYSGYYNVILDFILTVRSSADKVSGEHHLLNK